MGRSAALVTLLALTSLAVSAQSPDPAFRRAFETLGATWQSSDADGWSRLVDDNALIQHANGDVHVKRDEVEHIRSGTSKMSPRSEGEDRIVMVGGRNGATRRYIAESGLVTEIWRRAPDGEWLLVAHWEGWGHHPVLKGLVHAD